MEYIGIDVHKRDSQVCILGEGGEVVLEQRVRTQRERLGELLSKRPKARVLLEASTESEWVARYLEELGHEVVVADPNQRAHVRHAQPSSEDRQEGCAQPGGSVQVGGVPAGAPHLGRQQAHEGAVGGARGAGAHAHPLHLPGECLGEARGVADSG